MDQDLKGIGQKSSFPDSKVNKQTNKHGATKKHGDWDEPCFAMGYDCVTLSHGTGGHLADETDEFFQQLVNHAGGPSYDAIAFLCLNSV